MGQRGRWLAQLAAGVMACVLACSAQAQPAAFDGVALRDHRAQTVDRASLKGQLLLLNFVFTGCSSTCPLQTRELAELRRGLPAEVSGHVRFLSVSVDPLGDTPATLAAFARRMDADLLGWRFATGEPGQVDKLLDRMQVMDTRAGRAKPEDHRTSLYLFDANGALLQRYRGVPVDRARLADEITRLVRR